MNTSTLQIKFVAGTILAAMLLLTLIPFSAVAATQTVFAQGFEADTDGWFSPITRVASGTNGVVSAMGDFHAEVASGAFTRFDGYRDTWPGTWIAEVAVYLDPAWTAGQGFDYSVAASGSDGNHQRDYIFHVGMVEDYGPIGSSTLLVNASNNADFTTNPYKLVNDNGGDYYEVSEAGWYTLQHVFRDDGGALAVDLNLLDASGSTLWTATRTNVADTIPTEVGGNRYGWFTHVDVDGGVAIDESSLEMPLLDPVMKNDCKEGGWEEFGFDNQGQCVRFVETSKDSR